MQSKSPNKLKDNNFGDKTDMKKGKEVAEGAG
ncbi:hypothetical protein ADUPG1_014511, partial [Aduncisulcus paluster]